MTPPQQISRGGVYTYVCSVFGGEGEWPPQRIPTPNDYQDVAQGTDYEDHTVYLSSPGLHNG